MNRRQKNALIIFGILDLLVFLAIGWVAWPYVQDSFTTPTSDSPACAYWVFNNLPPELEGAAAWKTDHLYLSLHATTPFPQPPPEGEQLLWKGLDAVAAAMQSGCPTPTRISIFMNVEGQSSADQYVVHLAGADVKAWADNMLSMEELAARAAYRVFTGKGLRTP